MTPDQKMAIDDACRALRALAVADVGSIDLNVVCDGRVYIYGVARNGIYVCWRAMADIMPGSALPLPSASIEAVSSKP